MKEGWGATGGENTAKDKYRQRLYLCKNNRSVGIETIMTVYYKERKQTLL